MNSSLLKSYHCFMISVTAFVSNMSPPVWRQQISGTFLEGETSPYCFPSLTNAQPSGYFGGNRFQMGWSSLQLHFSSCKNGCHSTNHCPVIYGSRLNRRREVPDGGECLTTVTIHRAILFKVRVDQLFRLPVGASRYAMKFCFLSLALNLLASADSWQHITLSCYRLSALRELLGGDINYVLLSHYEILSKKNPKPRGGEFTQQKLPPH
jgi:hypothetical protein